MSFTYIEIRTFADDTVVKRVDVSGKSRRSIELVEAGMNRNLNHESYYTCETECETELATV